TQGGLPQLPASPESTSSSSLGCKSDTFPAHSVFQIPSGRLWASRRFFNLLCQQRHYWGNHEQALHLVGEVLSKACPKDLRAAIWRLKPLPHFGPVAGLSGETGEFSGGHGRRFYQ